MSIDEARMKEAWADPKIANIVYHDWEASTYDEKWSISYDERCISYARERYAHVAGDAGPGHLTAGWWDGGATRGGNRQPRRL